MRYNRQIEQYVMDLDYPIANYPQEKQTNNLINNIMNDFVKQDEKERIYIFLYRDDIISAICYKILKNIMLVHPFTMYMYGSKRKTKQYLDKGEKFISKMKLNKLIYSYPKGLETFIIDPYNPLYKVIYFSKDFKDLLSHSQLKNKIDIFYKDCKEKGYTSGFGAVPKEHIIKPMEKFTIQELSLSQQFFNIGYIKKDIIQLDDNRFTEKNSIKDYIDFCSGIITNFGEQSNCFYIPEKTIVHGIGVTCLKLTDNLERNIELLNKVEQNDDLVFYYSDSKSWCNEVPGLMSEYNFYVKRKINAPRDERNFNKYGLYPLTDMKFNFIGKWAQEEKTQVIYGID